MEWGADSNNHNVCDRSLMELLDIRPRVARNGAEVAKPPTGAGGKPVNRRRIARGGDQ
jgi:hypothetical protein